LPQVKLWFPAVQDPLDVDLLDVTVELGELLSNALFQELVISKDDHMQLLLNKGNIFWFSAYAQGPGP
jgi:hypothetical protein